MFKRFFTLDNWDQILIDTVSICYNHDRKSPTAVYVEVTGETVEQDIDKRHPFFTDKRVKKELELLQRTILTPVMIEVTLEHLMHLMIGIKSIRKLLIQWLI